MFASPDQPARMRGWGMQALPHHEKRQGQVISSGDKKSGISFLRELSAYERGERGKGKSPVEKYKQAW
jgi:hypothetical protein